jgi:hypothetical protein
VDASSELLKGRKALFVEGDDLPVDPVQDLHGGQR